MIIYFGIQTFCYWAQNYNHHPETGIISVTDAYPLIRRWNAKECYIVHYSGLEDLEKARNQWFRGPIKPMTSEQLQKTIDPNIPKPGGIDTFKMIVAKEGMTWISDSKEEQIQQNNNNSIGNEILIEGLDSYLLKFEKYKINNKLKVMVEDRIKRFDFSFDRPKKDTNRNDILYAEGGKWNFVQRSKF